MTGAGDTPRRRTGAGLAVHNEVHTLGGTMRETSPASATTAAVPTDAERALALEIVTSDELFESGERPERYVAQHLADVRAAGYAAGLAERQQLELEQACDDAHASGYAEGREVGWQAAVEAWGVQP